MRTILVTGSAGQVGTELARWAWPADVRLVLYDMKELDLTDGEATIAAIGEIRPDAVINAAAYTAVDRAETDVLTAWRVNAMAPAALAVATAGLAVPLVHISTDYVFDGSSPVPYLPSDPVGPLGVYGASKEAGEQAVRTTNPRHAIVRTAWLVSPHGSNFVKTMLRLGAERPLLRVIDDQRGSPTSAADLADALARIALRMIDDREAPTGTFHFVNAGTTTWYGFAEAVFEAAARAGRPRPLVEPITTAEYPTPAKRPAFSCLSTASLEATWGIRPRPWQQAIADILAELTASR